MIDWTVWLITLGTGSGAVVGFNWWWNKRMAFAKAHHIEHTHGPGILLKWYMRLLNLIITIYTRVTGKTFLPYYPASFLPESHYEEEFRVVSILGPEFPHSEQELRQAQRDGLKFLCESINDPKFSWSAFGRIAQFVTQRREFTSRQKMVKYASENPEILKVPIDRNNGLLIVTGLPRTGSTFLQALLALDPNARTPRTWEMWRPVPPAEGLDCSKHPSVIQMYKDVAQVDTVCKNYMDTLRRVHFFDAESPEEDTIFLYHAPWRWNMLTFLRGSKVADWWLNSAVSQAFVCRYLHLCLKVMISKFPCGHVITKNPGHSYYLDALLREFPEANIIVTHRNPVEVVPSWSKICLYSWHLFFQNEWRDPNQYEDLTVPGHKQSIMDQLVELAQRLVESRKRIIANDPEKAQKFFDLKYSDLTRQPIATIQRIYEHFGYEFSEEYRQRLEEYVNVGDRAKRTKYPTVPYTLEELNLTEDEINEKFHDYIESYSRYF